MVLRSMFPSLALWTGSRYDEVGFRFMIHISGCVTFKLPPVSIVVACVFSRGKWY